MGSHDIKCDYVLNVPILIWSSLDLYPSYYFLLKIICFLSLINLVFYDESFFLYLESVKGGGSYFAEVGNWPIFMAENGNIA